MNLILHIVTKRPATNFKNYSQGPILNHNIQRLDLKAGDKIRLIRMKLHIKNEVINVFKDIKDPAAHIPEIPYVTRDRIPYQIKLYKKLNKDKKRTEN